MAPSANDLKKLFLLDLLLCLSLFINLLIQAPEIQSSPSSIAPTDTQVEQAVLLTKQSTQAGADYLFPSTVAKRMNISYTVFNADQASLTKNLLYDGQVGRFSLIAVTAEAMKSNLNSTQRTILDNYEDQFGVAEALLGPVPTALNARYGVASVGTTPRFTELRWANNGLTNFMNTSMTLTTLASNTAVYAYGGNDTQSNPVLWSYSSGNKVRIASSVQSLTPYIGDILPYWATFWLASKLSSANKILKFYWSVDLDDVMDAYSDSGIYGAPPVSNLYFNGSDVTNMVNNFITPLGFNPTLAIEYYDVNNLSMGTVYPALASSLLANINMFDFTSHSHQLYQATTTYQMALDIIQGDRNAINSWGFPTTLYYMVPGKLNYTSVTAPAIADSPVWYVSGQYSSTTSTVPYIKNTLSVFDVWSPSLFRVARTAFWSGLGGLFWNMRTTGQVLNSSGLGTWDSIWRYTLEDMFSMYGFPAYWGGYRIEETHFENWVYGRQSADAPALQILKNATGIGIIPIVPVRSWALAENLYFIRNFKFNVTYDITQNTLTYTILKDNTAARDRITLLIDGNARPLDFEPLILHYDQRSTIVTLNYQTSITLKLGEQDTTSPHINNYQTSLLTAASLTPNAFSFTISAPFATASTTKIFVGGRGTPSSVWVNGVQQNTTGSYDPVSQTLTLTLNHLVQKLNVVLTWSKFDSSLSMSSSAIATAIMVTIVLTKKAKPKVDKSGSHG